MTEIYGINKKITDRYIKSYLWLPLKERKYFHKLFSMFVILRELSIGNASNINKFISNIEDEFTDTCYDFHTDFSEEHYDLITYCINLFSESEKRIKKILKIEKNFEKTIIIWIEEIISAITKEIKKYLHLRLV